ncbi:sulfite exporter TauE/SafE family protein [Xinfangfangia sp. D13-10-4-6]|uniref:sulfite exporter TauE/SafE family protein n=1 Tax=Pseudogemmobacter hezensis TaxID=2737662 RepID=UPI0015541F61|nr:sulfite exporter TauE/SafE family protein [Pseudogemmobacter hezensis]NPD14090.1 sulfite exporter TauE/SafE family protein [Pseudogemmobacter hezensis]
MFPDLSTLVPLILVLLAVGALAGIIAGLLGVGGGIVLVPAFFYVFTALGYDGPHVMQVCLATSLATIIFTSIRSVAAHNKKGAVDWEVLKSWAPGIVIGAVLGMLVASQLRSVVLQAIFGGLGMVVGLYMAFGKQSWRIADEMPKGPVRAVFSSVVGFLSVLMGIGGGSFGVPLMTLYGAPIHRAVATASGFGVTIALPSVIGFLFMPLDPASSPPLTLGAVNLPAFAVVIGITMVTTSYGVKLAHAMDPKPLKRIFALFLIIVAANMLRKALGW